MTSNNNILYLTIKADGLYKPGDVFHVKGVHRNNPRLMKFDGLTIKNIDYCFGVRLHFDLAEWSTNKNSNL
jgi:hypothetical protein